jgi:hypothetical protein
MLPPETFSQEKKEEGRGGSLRKRRIYVDHF